MQQQAAIFGDSELKREEVELVCGGHDAPDGKENVLRDVQGRASLKDSDPKRQKVEAVCGGHVESDRKENISSDGQGQAVPHESNTAEDCNFRLLSGAKNISGGVFTINLNNHYR